MGEQQKYSPSEEKKEMQKWIAEELNLLKESITSNRDIRWLKDHDLFLNDVENFLEFLNGKKELKPGSHSNH